MADAPLPLATAIVSSGGLARLIGRLRLSKERMREQVAKNLKRFREILGWTQEHLAEAAGLSGRTIQRAERDGAPSAETMLALAAVFEIPVADLQRAWSTEEDVRAALERAARRYTAIPLTRRRTSV